MSEIRIPFEMLIDYTIKLESEIKHYAAEHRDLLNKYRETKQFEDCNRTHSLNIYNNYNISDTEYEQRTAAIRKNQFDTYKRLMDLCRIAEKQDVKLSLYIRWSVLRHSLIRFNPSYDDFETTYKRLQIGGFSYDS